MAKQSAPDLEVARAELESADASIDAAKAGFRPTISSRISASRRINTTENTKKNAYEADITLEQPLFSFGRTSARVDSATHTRSASVAALMAQAVNLRSKLAKAWAQSLYFQELSEILKRNTARREANVQIVKLRYQGGREHKGSVLKTESAKLKTELDALEAGQKMILSKGDLEILVGQNLSHHQVLSGPIVMDIPAPNQKDPRQHPEVLALLAKHRQAQSQLVESRRTYFPELSLTASAQRSTPKTTPFESLDYAAGLTLTIPIFNGATSADVSQAAARTKSTATALAQANSTQQQRIKQTSTALDIAKQRMRIVSKIFEASRLQAEVSRQRYTLGLISFQDWDSYESDFMQSEVDRLNSELNVANAMADYAAAIGLSLEEEP
jgi:outer membrane protein TolC